MLWAKPVICGAFVERQLRLAKNFKAYQIFQPFFTRLLVLFVPQTPKGSNFLKPTY